MTERQVDPSLHRRRLRNALRQLREDKGLTQSFVATEMDWSLSKLIRIESGSVNIGTNDLRAILHLYGVEADGVHELVSTAKAARERSPWVAYRGVTSPEYRDYLGYESSARYVRNYESSAVPGLLQTEEYARELINVLPARDSADKEALVRLRMERQDLLSADSAPGFFFVMDESSLLRAVGGPQVMRRQLKHLLDVGSSSNVEVLIKPLSQGVYPSWRIPFVHLAFAGPDDSDVLFVELPAGDVVIREDSSHVDSGDPLTPSNYLDIFWEIEAAARLVDAESLIRSAIDRLADQ